MATAPLTRSTSPRKRAIYYPESDGKPVETDEHRLAASHLLDALSLHFASTDTYLAGSNGLYYVEGDPHKVVSPDAYVVFGVGSQTRRIYKTWENDGKTPDVVFELTSKKTKKEDLQSKYVLYEQTFGVPEYVLFDPKGEYLSPRLQGFRLYNGVYVPIAVTDGSLYSEELGLELFAEGYLLRLRDPKTKQVYPTLQESQKTGKAEARARQIAESARQAAERRVAEAEAQQAEDRAEIEHLRALLEAAQRKSES